MLLIVIPFIIYFIALYLVDFKHNYIFPIFIISLFLFGMTLKGKKEILLSFLPFLSVFFTITFLEGDPLIFILLLYLIFTPVSIILGYKLRNNSYIFKIIFPILIILFSVYNFEDYLLYGRNLKYKISNSTPSFQLYDQEQKLVNLNEIDDKLLILDFWNSTCGICFKKFPLYNDLAIEYKDNSNIKFYSVNIPVKQEKLDDVIKLAKRKVNYEFINLFANSESIPQQLQFNSYPHFVIIKNNIIVFNGKVNLREGGYSYNLRKIIEKNL